MKSVAAFGIAAVFGSVVLPKPWAYKTPKKLCSLLIILMIHINLLQALSLFPSGDSWLPEAEMIICGILADETACRRILDFIPSAMKTFGSFFANELPQSGGSSINTANTVLFQSPHPAAVIPRPHSESQRSLVRLVRAGISRGLGVNRQDMLISKPCSTRPGS